MVGGGLVLEEMKKKRETEKKTIYINFLLSAIANKKQQQALDFIL